MRAAIGTRTLLVAGLVVAFLLAGVVSYYASGHPDGLEYVAQKTGFLDTADRHAADDSPLAGYSTEGVDNPRLSGGIAGVTGAAVVLVLAGGLALALRRRGALPSSGTGTGTETETGTGTGAEAREGVPPSAG